MLSRKVMHTLSVALAFYLVSSPFTYRLVDRVVGGVVEAVVPQFRSLFKIAEAGCPTQYGLLVHTAVFSVVAHFILHMA